MCLKVKFRENAGETNPVFAPLSRRNAHVIVK